MRGRKLTIKEIEDRMIQKIVKRIETIEKEYGVLYIRRGCYRYYMKRGNELALKRKIKEAEEELQGMKKRTR